jgi:hypothetical protein
VTPDNLEELSPPTAAVGARGNSWALGAWASMNCTTIGRQTTSRGLSDRLGRGGRVVIDAGQCDLCREHSGEAVIGQDPLPPYHPTCSCVAAAVSAAQTARRGARTIAASRPTTSTITTSHSTGPT